MGIPVLDQSKIDNHPQAVLRVLQQELKEALEHVETCMVTLQNKKTANQLSQKDKDFIDRTGLQIWELIPGALQWSLTMELFYQYEVEKGPRLLTNRLLERGYTYDYERDMVDSASCTKRKNACVATGAR